MPRGTINVADRVEYLSVLDENGKLDQLLEPEIADDLLQKFFRIMLLARRFDERLLNLQRQGRIGTFAPVKGQEAAQVGSIAALQDSDWMVPSYRETAALIWRGTPLDGIILYNAGLNEGGRIPDNQNDLPISIPVGSQMLHAVGIGHALNYRGEDQVVMTYFGDGATSQGDFHEAMNFAGVFKTPVVFVCQNNQWAISVPRARQTASETLAQKALAYGLHGIKVDGNDVLAVYAATQEAVARARSERQATMIECLTYRLEVHTTADDPTRYRGEEEVEAWEKRDPLPRLQNYLRQKNLLSGQEIDALEQELKSEIEEAWERVQRQIERESDPLHMFEHIYAELPPYLRDQREALGRELKSRQGDSNNG